MAPAIRVNFIDKIYRLLHVVRDMQAEQWTSSQSANQPHPVFTPKVPLEFFLKMFIALHAFPRHVMTFFAIVTFLNYIEWLNKKNRA